MTKENAINLAKKYAEKNEYDFYVLNAPVESDTPLEPFEVCCKESIEILFPRASTVAIVQPDGTVFNRHESKV